MRHNPLTIGGDFQTPRPPSNVHRESAPRLGSETDVRHPHHPKSGALSASGAPLSHPTPMKSQGKRRCGDRPGRPTQIPRVQRQPKFNKLTMPLAGCRSTSNSRTTPGITTRMPARKRTGRRTPAGSVRAMRDESPGDLARAGQPSEARTARTRITYRVLLLILTEARSTC